MRDITKLRLLTLFTITIILSSCTCNKMMPCPTYRDSFQIHKFRIGICSVNLFQDDLSTKYYKPIKK